MRGLLRRAPWRTYFAVLAALAATRAALPHAVLAYVHSVFDGDGTYEARIGDLDLNLWRGSYELEHVALYREGRAGADEPLLECARIDLSIDWRELLDGVLRNSTVLHRPVLRVRLAEEDEDSQTGTEEPWRERLEALFPFRIDRLAVRDAELHYERVVGERTVDLYIEDFYLEALNLSNVADPDGSMDASLEAAGRPFGTAELEARMQFAPLASEPRLELAAQALGVRLPDLNDYLQDFLGVDAEAGEVDVFLELELVAQQLDGYVKTFVDGAQVLSMEEIDGPLDTVELAWEGIVSLLAELLENPSTGRIAARVPMSGDFSGVETDAWSSFVSVLGHAFLEALRPALDGSIVGRRATEESF